MKKTTQRHPGTMNELNITPMLDLVFVLLVIFIITTPQLMNNLEMNLPSGKPPEKKPVEPKLQRIEVGANGITMLNGTAVTAADLKTQLKNLKDADPELSVVVKGSDDVDYQHMVAVLDVLQQLDITKVGLATQ